MGDDHILKQLLRIRDDLFQICNLGDEKHENEISSRLIPLVDELMHVLLVDEGKSRLQ